MMQHLLNAMKLQAELAARDTHARMGTVSSFDPQTWRAKVMIQPENEVTGWMPVATEWVGNGWGMFAPPTAGDAVLVEFFHGDFEAGIITRRFFHNGAPPVTSPGTVPSGEFWLLHQSGSALKFHNDGSVELISNKNLTATVGGDMNATVTGTLNASGNAVNVTATGGKVIVKGSSEVDLLGNNQTAANGIVQGDCICAFTGSPHPMFSTSVKGSK